MDIRIIPINNIEHIALNRLEQDFIDEAIEVWDLAEGKLPSYKCFLDNFLIARWTLWMNRQGLN